MKAKDALLLVLSILGWIFVPWFMVAALIWPPIIQPVADFIDEVIK